MKKLLSAEHWCQVKPLEVVGQQPVARVHVLRLEAPEPPRGRVRGQAVQLEGALHGHVLAQMRELHLYQLLWVEGAMPVAA